MTKSEPNEIKKEVQRLLASKESTGLRLDFEPDFQVIYSRCCTFYNRMVTRRNEFAEKEGVMIDPFQGSCPYQSDVGSELNVKAAKFEKNAMKAWKKLNKRQITTK